MILSSNLSSGGGCKMEDRWNWDIEETEIESTTTTIVQHMTILECKNGATIIQQPTITKTQNETVPPVIITIKKNTEVLNPSMLKKFSKGKRYVINDQALVINSKFGNVNNQLIYASSFFSEPFNYNRPTALKKGSGIAPANL